MTVHLPAGAMLLAALLVGFPPAAVADDAAPSRSPSPSSETGHWQAPAEIPPGLPSSFAYADSIPGIRVDLRYRGQANFLGRPVDGYGANHLVMTRVAAEALARVQQDLAPMGLGLLVYDAYRPQRAVDHFVRWARDPDDRLMKAGFYPEVDKDRLFAEGYIAAKSGHSRGSTVDLTLVDLATGEPLDMGTAWDFFGEPSWVTWKGASAQQRSNRLLLRELMIKHGFAPYAKEWWHFRFRDEPYSDRYFDASIVPRD